MNWKTFFALLSRDAHVARRNFITLLLQTFLQPMMFVFIFGRVMVSSGYMPAIYKSLLLPGIMAISMIFTGVWAVAMPLVSEFQFTHEIEDRLLAPIENSWLAIEKVFFGAAQATVAACAHTSFPFPGTHPSEDAALDASTDAPATKEQSSAGSA